MSNRLLVALICTGLLLPSLIFSPPAPAGPYTDQLAPTVCAALADEPWSITVARLVSTIMNETGSSQVVAGELLRATVYEHCPWNRATVARFDKLGGGVK